MHWFCKVYDEIDDWTAYCVWAPNGYQAIKKLRIYVQDVEGYNPTEIVSEMWNTLQHGDINDYEVLS